MSDNIKVAIKVRPLIKREIQAEATPQWAIQGSTIFPIDAEGKKRGEGFTFDHILDMKKTNSDVFNIVAKPIVAAAINGFNGTIFAYGQTSSGKTYTMMGTKEERGVVTMAVEYIYNTISSDNTKGREYLLRVAYLEIYKEKVNDLLDQDNIDLKLHEDLTGQVTVKCKEEVANCSEHIMTIMKKGEKRRRVGETNMNDKSSRSHTIFRITIESRERSDPDGAVQVSQLNLVDLAGSEKSNATAARADRFQEGRHINLSLSTLGLVIMQLSEFQEGKHVNFRDSKLTRLLQASLGGNAMTAIICAVTPAALEETQCTLSFAARAKSIKNQPKLNEVTTDAALLKRYSKQVKKLEVELQELRRVNQCAKVEEMQSQLQEKDRMNQLLEERIELLKTRIVSGDKKSAAENSFKEKSNRRRTWGGGFAAHNAQRQSMDLPTIKEQDSKETNDAVSNKQRIKRRQSIMQTSVGDIVNEKFQTAIEDFELELIRSEQQWADSRYSTESVDCEEDAQVLERRLGNHVRFMDDVSVITCSYDATTPEKLSPIRSDKEQSPDTPKEVLRMRIDTLADEYESLREFTTLEKQMFLEEGGRSRDLGSMEESLNYMKKSVADSEMMCRESNKKLAELQDEHTELTLKFDATVEECRMLEEQVKKLHGIEERLSSMEQEKVQLQTAMNEKLLNLKKLEEERADYEFRMELLEKKHKTREKELENSLQLAWKDVMDTTNKEKFFDAVHLRTAVDSLSKENETLKSKLGDFETSLKTAEEMKSDLVKQLEELTEASEKLTSCNEVVTLRKRVEELESELETLKIVPVNKGGEILELPEFQEPSIPTSGEEHIKNVRKEEFGDREETINKLNIQLEELTARLEENCKIKSDFEVLQTESDQLKAELSNREDTISKLTMQLDEMSARLEENSNIKSDFELMQTQCDQLKEELSSREAIVMRLTEEMEKLKSSLEADSDIKFDFEAIKAKCEEQEIEISTLGNRMAEMSASELQVTTEHNLNLQKLEQVQSEKELVMNENLELKSKFSETTDVLRNNEQLIDSLKSDIDELKSKLEEKSFELSNMKVKFGELQEISVQVEYSSKEPTTDNTQRITVLEEELENSRNELNAKLEEINKQKSEIANLVDEVTAKTDEISSLNETIDRILREKEELQNNLRLLTEELESKTIKSESGLPAKYKDAMPEVDISFEQLYTEMITQSEGIHDKLEGLTETEIAQNNVSHSKGEVTDLETILEDGHSVKNNTSTVQEKDIQEKTNRRSIVRADVTGIENTGGNIDDEATSNGTGVSKHEIVPSDSFENVNDALKMKLRNLVLENDALVLENTELKNKIEMFIQEVTVQASSEDINAMQVKLAELNSTKNNLEKDMAERNKKICDLQNDVKKWKEQVIGMQSERTLLEGEKCAMQKIIKQKEEELRRIPKLEAHVKDLDLVKAEFEHMNAELRKELNAKTQELDSKDAQKYESEIRNLKSYVADLELFNKNIQTENDELKTQLHDHSLDLENDMSELKRRVDEQERITHILEEDKQILLQRLNKPQAASTESTVNISNMSTTQITTPKSSIKPCSLTCDTKTSQAEGEISSIFANASYFEDLDVSYDQDESVFEQTNQTVTEVSLDATDCNSTNTSTRNEEKSMTSKTLLEEENAKLTVELQLKIQKYDEIMNDFNMLKLHIEKTVQFMTTENTDLASKLNAEKERAKTVETGFEAQVNDLYSRICKLTEERASLESELLFCQEQLETLRSNTPIATEDVIRAKFEEYNGKINSLTAENIELSSNLMEKIEELEKVKESKALLYDHDCMYKEQVELHSEKLETLNYENIELSSSLMEKIEELDSLKNTYELLEKKLEVFKNNTQQSVDGAENNVIQLRVENNQLKSEIIELEAKVKTLTKENTKFSNNLMETMEELDNTRNNDNSDDKGQAGTLHLSVVHNNSIHDSNNDAGADENIDILSNKVKILQEQIDQLTRLNKKLSELKQSSCVQCTHLKELNDSRRTLKLEVKCLNHKLVDLQRKFEQKCADTDILRKKASEDFNCSIVSDTTLNESMVEGMDVTFVEEKIQTLNGELEALKENHDVLSALYKDKCSELEKLQENSICEVSLSLQSKPISPDTKKNRARIERIQEDVDELRKELQLLCKRNTNLSEFLHKFLGEKSGMQNEIDALRSAKEELIKRAMDFEMSAETAQEKVKILESEMSNLNEEMKKLTLQVKQLENEKLNLEVASECLEAEKKRSHKTLELIEASLNQEKENHGCVREKLDTLMKENNELVKRLEESQKECTKVAKESDNKLNTCLKENIDLTEKIKSLQATLETVGHNRKEENIKAENTEDNAKLISVYENLKAEHEAAREYIIKEIRSLKPKLESSDFLNKSVSELLSMFFNIVMQKEKEIIKAVQDSLEQDKHKLEDEKRQSLDAQKRTMVWAKELESEIEKLQTDLSSYESKNRILEEDIIRLENKIKESNHENQLLRDQKEVLETDFNSLQAELEKRSKVDDKQDEVVIAAQEREKSALEAAKNSEAEFESRMKIEKDQYNKRIEELTSSYENCRTKNMELRNNIEGLEANEKQLKSILEVKSNDLAKTHQRLKTLEAEIEQLTETCNQLKGEVLDKTRHIKEITSLLKSKCDKLSEFKTKLETITPEYELLKEQVKERRLSADRYKNEFEILRIESQKQLDYIKDKLSEEEIKTGGLNKQLAELDNRNAVLLAKLEEMKGKCEELEMSNDKLVQKMRNSTSKTKFEAQVEDLKDQIATLQKNMEGASNRITELQDTKSQTMRDLVALQGKYDMLIREKNELERALTANKAKSNSPNLNKLQAKYDALLQEKNRIALELEAKKLLIIQKENDCSNYKNEIEQLKLKNKELDEEMDDMVRVIDGLNKDNAELTVQIFELGVVPKTISIKEDEVDPCKKINQRRASITGTTSDEKVKHLTQKDGQLHEKIELLTKQNDALRKENEELNAKMLDWDVKAESKSCNTSRSGSPLLENTRRKKRRSDLFNQNRQLENSCNTDTNTQESSTCRCVALAQQNRDLELEVVRRNGRIAALELQIQSENFPYQNKCRDLEENLLAFKNKNIELRTEIKRLQRAMTETSVRDCELCRRRRTNQRDQTTQTMPECKTFLSGMSSGVVDEHMRIQRLEKEKALMKDLCRARMRQIKELEKKIADFEGTPKADELVPAEEAKRYSPNENIKSSSNKDKPHVFSQNSKRAMKENLPANILGKATCVSSSRGKNIWNTYS